MGSLLAVLECPKLRHAKQLAGPGCIATILVVALVIPCFLVLSARAAPAATSVAVIEFTNKSGYPLPDIDTAAGELLSVLLAQTGQFRVVEREKLKNVIEEQGLVMSGLVESSSTAVQVGRLIGADLLVFGSILSVETTQTSFSGYGFTSDQTVVQMVAGVRVLDTTTAELRYSRVLSAKRTLLSTSHVAVKSPDIERELLREILAKAAQELAVEVAAGPPAAAAPQVLVRFESSPEGAEVEVDGLYVGVTPLELHLSEGVHRVVISRGGYEAWDKRVKVYEGLKVSVVLVPAKEEKDR